MKRWRRLLVLVFCLLVPLQQVWANQDLLAQGIAAQKAGNNELALTLLGKYLEQNPGVTEVRRHLALALASLGRNT